MSISNIFDQLWSQYIETNPNVARIHNLFTEQGEHVKNDHIALRTFNDPRVNIDKVSAVLRKFGYEEQGEYHFEKKNLYAKHFAHPTEDLPKVFISELLLENFSKNLQFAVKNMIDSIPVETINSDEFIVSGRLWGDVSFKQYEALREESEYAAWVYVFGYCANHFTVSIDELKKFDTIESVNAFIEANGFEMNSVGGKVKGSPEVYLEQSSTLANPIEISFEDGVHSIPSVFYEFATRYKMENGTLFEGFIADNADKIFESTNFVK